MNHRQNDPGADELRAKFTAWLEVVIKHAKLDYVRTVSYTHLDVYKRQEEDFAIKN